MQTTSEQRTAALEHASHLAGTNKWNAAETITAANKFAEFLAGAEANAPIKTTAVEGLNTALEATAPAKRTRKQVVATETPKTETAPEEGSMWDQVREKTLALREADAPALRKILDGFKVKTIQELVGKQHQSFIDQVDAALEADSFGV